MKIFLDKFKSKESRNLGKTLAVDLVGSKKLLPIQPIEKEISELDVYNNERSACTEVRLICSVNTIASNILFNNITEIIKDEGSENVRLYNVSGITQEEKKKVMANKGRYFDSRLCPTLSAGDGMEKYKLAYQAIRDTQISSENFGYQYHCGHDIFNNHTLRSLTFKSVCPYTGGTSLKDFNTISDYLRDFQGTQIKFYNDKKNRTENKPTLKAHVYLDEEILSYPNTIKTQLIEENGWLGFKNVEKFPMYNGKKPYDFSKTINNRKACDFIDMYPERDLFSFVPKYNPHRRRIEKNWNYCLTYPSSSTTEVSFIREGTNSLKVILFDDDERNSNGTSAIKIISVAQHGLVKGAYVNIYKGDSIAINNAEVTSVENEYIFFIKSNGQRLSSNWVQLSSYTESYTDEYGRDYVYEDRSRKILTTNDNVFIDEDGEYVTKPLHFFVLDRNKTNIDRDAQDISFKRVINGVECKYYVRIFSRIPNWRFAEKMPSEEEMYKEDSTLIQDYQKIDNEFENHIGKLGFARNVYNDEIAEIVFTDNINIDGLRDNLGRPLTEIYFTSIKNNAGFKEWYGKNGTKVNFASDTIEYSHCFGKISCAFRLSEESLVDKQYENILSINAVRGDDGYQESGMTITNFLNDRHDALTKKSSLLQTVTTQKYLEDDEIYYNEIYSGGTKLYDGDVNFYGDLCCYSEYLCKEQSIQQVEFRFNTAQRELNGNDGLQKYFYGFCWDEIKYDDFDGTSSNNFELEKFKGEAADQDKIANYSIKACNRKEGYCYEPHHKIPIRTFSNNLESAYPIFYLTKALKVYNIDTKEYTFHLLHKHSFSIGQHFELFDKITHARYNCVVTKIPNTKTIVGSVNLNTKDLPNDVNVEDIIDIDILNRVNYRLFIKYDDEIPNYATFVKDGSCRFYWRKIMYNGSDKDSNIEEYPFTNNALYINENINLYVKRQDPNNVGDLWTDLYPYDYESRRVLDEDYDDYYDETEIEC